MDLRMFLQFTAGCVAGTILWGLLLKTLPEYIDKHTPDIPYIARIYHSFGSIIRFWFSIPYRIIRYLFALLMVCYQIEALPDNKLFSGMFGHVPQVSHDIAAWFNEFVPKWIFNMHELGLLASARWTFNMSTKQIFHYHEDILVSIVKIVWSSLLCSFGATLYTILYSPYVFVLILLAFLLAENIVKGRKANSSSRFIVDPFFKKYFDEDGVLIADVTATPADALDSYVSICACIDSERFDWERHTSSVYRKECLVRYPSEYIDEMIKITKRRARRRSMEAFCHAINPFYQLDLVFDRYQNRAARFCMYILSTPIIAMLYICLWAISLPVTAFLFSMPFVLTAFWIRLGYTFAHTMGFLFIGICTAAISLHIWIVPIAKTFFVGTRLWATATLIKGTKAIRKCHKAILAVYDVEDRDILQIGKVDYLGTLKHAYKRYRSFREEDNFNVSERLSELEVLKLINTSKHSILLDLKDEEKLYVTEYSPKTMKAKRRIVLDLNCMVYKYSNRPMLHGEGLGNAIYKIDLLNHLIVVE